MRILLVTDWVSNEGGVENYHRWIRAPLEDAGDEVRLLVSAAGSRAGGQAEYVARSARSVGVQGVLQVVNPFSAATMRRAIREFRPDVIHVTMFEMHLSPSVVLAAKGVPTVISVAYYKPVCPTGLKLLPDGTHCVHVAGGVCLRQRCVSLPHWLRDVPRYRRIERALSGVDRLLACSGWLRDELARYGLTAESFPWPVPPPGTGFRRAPAATPQFVFVGRLGREKGVAVLLDAFATVLAAHPAARLRIVGDGVERAPLERRVAALGITGQVEFVGAVPGPEVERYLGDAWALVAPSLWAEPLGLVAVEALVRGVPVVASAAGGFADTIEDGRTGLLVPNGDAAALADRLGRVARGDVFPDHAVPSEAAAALAERHDLDLHVAHLRDLLAAVAAGRPGNG